MMTNLKPKIKKLFVPLTTSAWSPVSLLVITAFIATLYLTAEWVFVFTRPSFLQTIPFVEKSRAFFAASGLLTLFSLALISLPLLAGWIIRNNIFRKVLTIFAFLAPAFLLASMALMMLDNFTYTIFHFGIVSTSGWSRALYGAIFTLFSLFLVFKLIEFHNLLAIFFTRLKPPWRVFIPLIILVTAFAAAALPARSIFKPSADVSRRQTAASRSAPPDILLITVDAVNAEYTSLDNTERDTTPFLRGIADESLVGLNAFSNAQGTIGSITALLTGKYPVKTRVINSSDILRGEDAYQHLPDILEDYGYYTAQLSNAVYADAYKINFQDAFKEANGRSTDLDPLMFALSRFYPGVDHLFQQEVVDRVSARLGHIFFINDMANPYEQVTEAPLKFDDREKILRLFKLLEEVSQPVFVHLHWMGTHGPNYYPEQQVFSEGLYLEHQGTRNQLFYFDAVLEFDRAVEEIFTYLKNNGMLENTILVVTSDHSQKWTNSRIPLLIRFPQAENSGTLAQNIQTIDIAPTLLDYLDITVPEWMAGQSLISSRYEPNPIITARIPKSKKDPVTGKVIYPESKPPFYQFGRMSVIVCDQWFELDFQTMNMTRGVVENYQAGCGVKVNQLQALELLIDHLQRYGYDTSSLEPLRITFKDGNE